MASIRPHTSKTGHDTKEMILSKCISDYAVHFYYDKHCIRIKLKCLKRDEVSKLLKNGKMTTIFLRHVKNGI